MVVSQDGEFPQLEIFPDLDALTRRMRAFEGEGVNAFPFYGVPVPYTVGPDRLLQLPDGTPHPLFNLSPYGKFVADPDAVLPLDLGYYLGPDIQRSDFPESAVVDHRPAAGKPQAGTAKRSDPTDQ